MGLTFTSCCRVITGRLFPFRYRRKRLTYRVFKFFHDLTRKRNRKYEDEPIFGKNVPVVMALSVLFMLMLIWLHTHESRPLHRGHGRDNAHNSGDLSYLKPNHDSFKEDEAAYEGESKQLDGVDIPF